MLLGQSVFQSVLTRLRQERSEDEEDDADVGFRIASLGVGFVGAQDSMAAAASGTEAYFDFLPERSMPTDAAPLQEEEPPAMPPHLLRLRPDEVAEELAIGENESEHLLADKRRRFAKDNHPDRLPEHMRENAAIRMTIANLLIDGAIRNARLRNRFGIG